MPVYGPLPSGAMIPLPPRPGVFGPGPLVSVAGHMASALTGPYWRDMAYSANRVGIRASPPPDAALAAYWSRLIGGPDEAAARRVRDTVLGEHGIWWPQSMQSGELEGGFLQARSDIWQSYIALSQPWCDWRTLREGWLRDYDGSTINDVQRALGRQGIHDKHWLKLMVEMGEQLGVNEILQLYWLRLLPPPREATVRQLLRGKGYTDDATIDSLLSLSHSLSPAETLMLWNRDAFGPRASQEASDVADWMLEAGGLHNPRQRDYFRELAKEIPGPGDLVRFAVREVFNPSLAARYGFGEEFPDDFRKWIEKQGYTETFQVSDPDGSTVTDMNWALAYWIAHWQWPSPTQGNEFLHRARGNPDDPATWRIPGLKPFLSGNLRDLLKAEDYPPFFRPYLEAISYRVLDKRDINWAVKAEIFDNAGAMEAYQDQGYTPADAQRLADMADWREQREKDAWKRSLVQASKKKIVSCVIDHYRIGSMDRASAEGNLARAGVWPRVRNRLLDGVELCETANQIKEAIRGIRGLFLRGEISEIEARVRLASSAIVPERIDRYLSLWRIELNPRRRRLGASQLLAALEAGFIDEPYVIASLGNLGWSGADTLVLLAMGRRAAARHAIAEAEKVSAKVSARNRELTAQIRETKAVHDRLVADLRRNEPLGTLKSLAKKGRITKAEFVERLTAREIPLSSQSYYLEEVYG